MARNLPTDSLASSAPRSIWSRWGAAAFTLDLRSLALFRIGIGGVLLADLIFRARVLTPLYSDSGVLRRTDLFEFTRQMDRLSLWQWGSPSWSFHFLSGEPAAAVCLFCLAGFFAILVSLGLWTRLATIASFVLLVSLHNRNPFILHSGDTMLRLTMFWSMFLPLGQIWSVDAWRRRRRGEAPPSELRYCSPASAGLIVQVFILYFFTGVAKLNSLWWNGDAMFVVLNLSIYVRDFGRELRQWPWLHQGIAYATLATEILFPPLLLVGYRNNVWRWLNLITFCGLHLGVLLCMSIGLFSFICFVIWIALIPGAFWNWCGIRGSMPLADGARTAAGERLAARRPRLGQTALHYFCGVMIAYMLVWNVLNMFPRLVVGPVESVTDGVPLKEYVQRANPLLSAYERFGQALGVGQHFQMFGNPYHEDPWFVYRAKLANGEQVDIFDGRRSWRPGQPLKGIPAMPAFHWRKFHHDLVANPAAAIRQRMLDYQVEEWNRRHDIAQRVQSATLECYLDTVWPVPLLGEVRGATVWAKSPPDAPETSAFDQMYDRIIGEGENPGF